MHSMRPSRLRHAAGAAAAAIVLAACGGGSNDTASPPSTRAAAASAAPAVDATVTADAFAQVFAAAAPLEGASFDGATQAGNQIHAVVDTAPEQLRRRFVAKPTTAIVAEVALFRRRQRPDHRSRLRASRCARSLAAGST